MAPAKKDPDISTYSGRLAKRLRTLREEAGLSVEEMVERMARFGYPVQRPTYYAWENGGKTMALDSLPAVAKALKLKSVRDVIPTK